MQARLKLLKIGALMHDRDSDNVSDDGQRQHVGSGAGWGLDLRLTAPGRDQYSPRRPGGMLGSARRRSGVDAAVAVRED